jgi:hypothetical protein
MCADGYTHRKDRPIRRHVKALTCYEIGQQADYNYWLERLLIEAFVILSLLYPTDGYQHPRWACLWTPTNTINWRLQSWCQPCPMCAYGYTHRKGRPIRRHAEPRHAHSSVTHVRSMVSIKSLPFVPPSLSLSMNANDHSQLTSLSPDVKPCDNHAQCRAYTIPFIHSL